MKVLLVNPPYKQMSRHDSRALSMALVYLGSVLKARGHDVTLYNAALGPVIREDAQYRYGASDEETQRFFEKTAFDLVGFSCAFAFQWKFVLTLAQQVKKVSPQCPVLVGGLYPTYDWKGCLSGTGAIDAILLGEAELSLAALVQNLSEGKSLASVCQGLDGVAWKDHGAPRHNPKTIYNHALDTLPFPDWSLVDLKVQFANQQKQFNVPARSLPILSSRSCPNRCSFCNMYLTHGPHWRARSAANVVQEIENNITRFGVDRFYFIDDNFSFDKERAKAICRLILEKKLRIQYTFPNGLSLKAMDEELVRLLKSSGCIFATVAVESGSERIRNGVYKKNLKTEEILRVCELLHQARIPTQVLLMVGAPTETADDVAQTKKLIARLPVDCVGVSIFTPYPGTALYDECLQKGWLLDQGFSFAEKMDLWSPILCCPEHQAADVLRWQAELLLVFLAAHPLTIVRNIFTPTSVVTPENFLKLFGLLLRCFKIAVCRTFTRKPQPKN